jgi:glycosyltransferase involved in cell wall biosynthesis
LEESPVREVVLLPGYVPDDDLPAFYAGAQALILPSVYEGFGLPVLEAMVCGTPAVASNASSIPEIGGDAALYFDPLDVEAIVDAIRRLLRDISLRDEMRERGLARAARFSWQQAAAETRAVYDAVIKGA